MTAVSLAGAPFAAVVAVLLVWSLCLLVGTLGSLDTRGDESDENGPEW